MNRVILFLATLGPIGTRLPAPGTMGSLAGVSLFAFMTLVLHVPAPMLALLFVPCLLSVSLFVREQKFFLIETIQAKLFGMSLP